MNYFKPVGITLFFLFFSLNSVADEVYLKNGDHITGELINLSPNICTFITPYQATLHIQREQLLRLSIEKPVVIELYSSERFIGSAVTSNEDGMVSVHSQRFGTLTLQITEIKKIMDLQDEMPANLPSTRVPTVTLNRQQISAPPSNKPAPVRLASAAKPTASFFFEAENANNPAA